MLILVSDLHLREGARSHLSRVGQFARFWERIEQTRRDEVAHLCIVGDLFDLVRSPSWLATPVRPYHEPSPELEAEVLALVRRTVAAEKDFLGLIRAKIESGALVLDYVIGNHDRLLNQAPRARAVVREALGIPGGDAPFPTEARFPEYGVLAYHGHVVDALCSDPSGAPPLSDMIAPELIVRFPDELRRAYGFDHPHLDDIDDVRPIIAVPTWVRTLARDELHVGDKITRVWSGLVEQFLDNRMVADWFRSNHRRFKLDFAQKVKLLLSLSARRGLGADSKLTSLNGFLFKLLDSKFAHAAVRALERPENRSLRYVVNGHTHFAGMTPLGLVEGKSACYFNVGTWRTVHQLGNVARGRPSFLAYDAMAYLVFFPKGDELGREFEWWQGAATSLESSAPVK